MGIRGCNSLTEYIHLVRFVSKAKKIKNIIFLSGMNDLYLRLVHDNSNDIDPGFGTKYSNISSFHPFRQSLSLFFSKIYGIEPEEIIDKKIFDMIFKPYSGKNKSNKKKLSINDKIIEYFSSYKRNFLLYKGLSYSFNCNVIFINQPLVFWTNKIVSEKESLVLDYLNKLRDNDYWNVVKKVLTKDRFRDNIISNFNDLSNKFHIKFFDSNILFKNNDETCFVDSIHLTDIGNEIIADQIVKLLK